MNTPQPGDIGLTQISGRVGKGIRLGQWLNGNGFENYEHAFTYLGLLGPGQRDMILEAEPGGARIVPLHYSDVYWCTNISRSLTDGNRRAIVALAPHYKDIPYSFLDYDALAMHRLHVDVPGLRDFIADSGHMICSQMADHLDHVATGRQIFMDQRWDGYVTPGSLYEEDRRRYGMS